MEATPSPVYVFLCQEDEQRLFIPRWSFDRGDYEKLKALRNLRNDGPKLMKVTFTLLLEGDVARMESAATYIKRWQ